MAKKKKTKQTIINLPQPGFNHAFEALASIKKDLALNPKQDKKKELPLKALPVKLAPAPQPPSDDILFMEEMSDVMPLPQDHKKRPKAVLPPKAWQVPEMPDEDLEVLRTLTDLVTGKIEFDLKYTSEYVEGQTKGLPPVLMEKLRQGRIPYQNHLDLHGLTVMQAEAAVTSFILDSVALGRTCVLLIHGRGLGSKDGIPVLKRYLEAFLLRGVVRKYILAFTTAQTIDGGLGASYILLRS